MVRRGETNCSRRGSLLRRALTTSITAEPIPRATRPKQSIRLQTKIVSSLTNQPELVAVSMSPVMPMTVMVVIPTKPPVPIVAGVLPTEIEASMEIIGVIERIIVTIKVRSVVAGSIVGTGLGPEVDELARYNRGLIFRLSNLQGL